MGIARLITTADLAERWGMKPETLRVWRYQQKGPPYVKIGRRVAYREADITKYENDNLIQHPA